MSKTKSINVIMKMSNNILTYSNQLDFKRYAHRRGIPIKKDFYFDYVTGVDKDTSNDIDGLAADGTLTFADAYAIVLDYFKNKH